jgi:tetratricopeptide (TPR) repeat protein
LFVIVVWLLSEAAARVGMSRVAQLAIALAVLFGYAAATHVQIGFWRNSYRLFAHAVQVTPANGIAEGNLGAALMEMQRPDLAQPHLEHAAELTPTLATPHYNLGTILLRQNALDRAQREYQLALKYPSDEREAAQTHNNLGVLFSQLGRNNEAEAEYTQALRLNPYEQNSFMGRGRIEQQQGRLDAALQDFTRAAQIAPSPNALYWQGRVLEDKGRLADATAAYEAALKLAPDFKEAQARLENLKKAGK